jgi:hypothetical protein
MTIHICFVVDRQLELKCFEMVTLQERSRRINLPALLSGVSKQQYAEAESLGKQTNRPAMCSEAAKHGCCKKRSQTLHQSPRTDGQERRSEGAK